ncbi:MAG TPA: hydroxymethylglutaryl-CoA lyase [Chitinophagaceae bacterium]|nr:hydroxymethylglutaryl-CoA lyase [Chitinophagaceae bacterium]
MNTETSIKLIECPRDAMQGWPEFIPTETKITYLNQLLKVGFDTLDAGSFVSPKAIPQMADTAQVLPKLNLEGSQTKLLTIIANTRGADDAVSYDEVTYLGFPFSISETFQKLNTNSSISDSLKTIEAIQQKCEQRNKQLVTYISMGFGNPYGDEYSSDIAIQWVEKLATLGLRIFAMSDTVGVSNPENIATIFSNLVKAFPQLEFGAHFHSTMEHAAEKLEAALANGCHRFDSALYGIGGCPMAQNDLVGNIATEQVTAYFASQNIALGLDEVALQESMRMARQIFHV